MEYTGERFVPELDGEIRHMHLHRYAVAQNLIKGKAVLDIASGEGYGAALLAKTATSAVGVDISAEAIEHARRHYATQHNLEFRQGSCDAIPLTDASIDVVTSFETIEHHDKHVEMMREIKRVLRPDGLLVISSPNRPLYSERFNLVNPFHVKELDYEGLVRLLNDHFQFVHVYGQKLAAGSFVFPLERSSHETFVAYEGHGVQIDRKTPVLNLPEFFLAICSDAEINNQPGFGSIFVDPEEELLQSTHDELSWMRANYLRESLLLEEIRSSLGFKVLTRLVWPVTRYIVPR